MRWLAHRGGALDLRDWMEKHPGEPFPVSVAFGADPATILGAVTPVPDTLSEYAFAGLLRGSRTEVVKSISNDLEVPASAEIVLEVISILTNLQMKVLMVTTRVITTRLSAIMCSLSLM